MRGVVGDECRELVHSLLMVAEFAQRKGAIVVWRAVVARVGRDIAVEGGRCHVVLSGEIIHQAAVEIADLHAGIDQLDQPEVRI